MRSVLIRIYTCISLHDTTREIEGSTHIFQTSKSIFLFIHLPYLREIERLKIHAQCAERPNCVLYGEKTVFASENPDARTGRPCARLRVSTDQSQPATDNRGLLEHEHAPSCIAMDPPPLLHLPYAGKPIPTKPITNLTKLRIRRAPRCLSR